MDEPTFQTFYQKTAPGLRSYIRLLCNGATLADDFLQESFYRFLRSAPSALNDFQMKSYLYKTASSLIADHWRAQRHEENWREKALVSHTLYHNPNIGHDVMRCFHELKPQEQALLWLAYVEGFDHREISAILDVKSTSVRVLLIRARKKLSSVLAKKGLTEEEGY